MDQVQQQRFKDTVQRKARASPAASLALARAELAQTGKRAGTQAGHS